MLGILYESYIHPITILSTLPSAGVGALLALMLTHTDLTVIAIIGIILLIGIVKKNAIMMIDFALAAERNEGKSSRDSIYEACLLRFRPILMTTMAAMLGALPLALGTGTGSEFRRPLGIAIIGGLIVSQLLTLVHDAGGLPLLSTLCSSGGTGFEAGPVPSQDRGFGDLNLGNETKGSMAKTFAKSLLRSGGTVPSRRNLLICLAVAGAALGLSSCKVGPEYKRPARGGSAGLQGDSAG